MKNFRAAIYAPLLIAFAFSIAQGQATRTWVSGVGDDVNPCSRTAPCKTFAGAINRTITGGEIDALDPGGFGQVIISKSITIDGTATLAGILANSTTTGVSINITSTSDTAKSVRLRGLSINGVGSGTNGINVIAANKVSVEDCVIDGFTGNGILVAAGGVFIKNSTIRNNAVAGINVSGTTVQVDACDTSLIYNGTGAAGPNTAYTWSCCVVFFGNTTGDPLRSPMPAKAK